MAERKVFKKAFKREAVRLAKERSNIAQTANGADQVCLRGESTDLRQSAPVSGIQRERDCLLREARGLPDPA
jgi:hypothetical protein